MMLRFTIWLFALSSVTKLLAQEDDFSQFMLSSVYMNPAYASTYTDLALNMNYKLQKLEQATIQTTQVSLVFPLKTDQVSDNVAGIGLMAFNQSFDDGLLTENAFYLTYSQNFTLGLLGCRFNCCGCSGRVFKICLLSITTSMGITV